MNREQRMNRKAEDKLDSMPPNLREALINRLAREYNLSLPEAEEYARKLLNKTGDVTGYKRDYRKLVQARLNKKADGSGMMPIDVPVGDDTWMLLTIEWEGVAPDEQTELYLPVNISYYVEVKKDTLEFLEELIGYDISRENISSEFGKTIVELREHEAKNLLINTNTLESANKKWTETTGDPSPIFGEDEPDDTSAPEDDGHYSHDDDHEYFSSMNYRQKITARLNKKATAFVSPSKVPSEKVGSLVYKGKHPFGNFNIDIYAANSENIPVDGLKKDTKYVIGYIATDPEFPQFPFEYRAWFDYDSKSKEMIVANFSPDPNFLLNLREYLAEKSPDSRIPESRFPVSQISDYVYKKIDSGSFGERGQIHDTPDTYEEFTKIPMNEDVKDIGASMYNKMLARKAVEMSSEVFELTNPTEESFKEPQKVKVGDMVRFNDFGMSNITSENKEDYRDVVGIVRRVNEYGYANIEWPNVEYIEQLSYPSKGLEVLETRTEFAPAIRSSLYYKNKIIAKLNKKAEGKAITAYTFVNSNDQTMLLLVDSNNNGVLSSGEPKSPEEVKYVLNLWDKHGGYNTKEFTGEWDLSDPKEANDALTFFSMLI